MTPDDVIQALPAVLFAAASALLIVWLVRRN